MQSFLNSISLLDGLNFSPDSFDGKSQCTEVGLHFLVFSFYKKNNLDLLDIVKDPVSGGDYVQEEDPRIFQSEKTKRGPLDETWRTEYVKATQDPANKDKAIMCAYKLCKVEFKYWGMQSKIERFIHDIGTYSIYIVTTVWIDT